MRCLKAIVFYLGKSFGLFSLARFLTRQDLRILAYHGFALKQESEFRPHLFIEKAEFQKRLSILKALNFPVLGLEEALSKLKDGSLPHNAVVLTIDDGWYSVLPCAFPLLMEYNFPATIYITTYYSEKQTPVFRLVVQYFFWKTFLAKVKISASLGGEGKEINLLDETQRKNIQNKIISFGEALNSESERQNLLHDLAVVLDVDFGEVEESRFLSLLNREEILALADKGMDIQLHTHRHNFPEDDEEKAKNEIRENQAILEGNVGSSCQHFCYPSGEWSSHQWTWLN